MVLNTLTVGAAVTPSVINTAISHYIKRKPLRGKPTAHISYDEGLHLVRQFLDYASNHTVDEVQAFTAQWVPCPRWVKATEVTISLSHSSQAASLIQAQLGPQGLEAAGGKEWWQWRPASSPLKAEWIEMRAHYNARKTLGSKAQRIMLYIHGGAYFFGSVDEHRYQLQRHARKLKARLLAPRYRLSPQYPFPCGLQDALAAYLMLLDEYDPKTILLAGDSAGAGMILSLLVTLRDQGVALPAGAILISPWVDLTHSFPSVSGEGKLDYIPPYGFHHRPSMAWPPPNDEEMRDLRGHVGQPGKLNGKAKKDKHSADGTRTTKDGCEGPENTAAPVGSDPPPSALKNLSIDLDGKHVELLDQIQLYATNTMLAHPLVSPAMQPSLGGLPPLLIQCGGGELLQDEQIYVAHKAANPQLYPPPDSITDEHDPERKHLHLHGPTKVQLQVWEDLCHVPHTLSFTRPAKHMYRAVAQFGNWCYAQSGHEVVDFDKRSSSDKEHSNDDDTLSVISTSTSSSDTAAERDEHEQPANTTKGRSLSDGAVPSQAGGPNLSAPSHSPTRSHTSASKSAGLGQVNATAPLPLFEDNMIRQLVTRHGTIFPLPPPSDLPACNVPPASIGVIKPGPVRKWLAKRAQWDKKFASAKRKVQARRLEELRKGYVVFEGETPPPTALAGRRVKGRDEEMANLEPGLAGRKKKSWGLAMWSGWGSKHDEVAVESSSAPSGRGAGGGGGGDGEGEKRDLGGEERSGRWGSRRSSRSRSVGSALRSPLSVGRIGRSRAASKASTRADAKKAGEDEVVPPVPKLVASDSLDPRATTEMSRGDQEDATAKKEQEKLFAAALPDGEKVKGSENTFLAPSSNRPHAGVVAYPFKLRSELGGHVRSASTMTLDSGMDEDGLSRNIDEDIKDEPLIIAAGDARKDDSAEDNEADVTEKEALKTMEMQRTSLENEKTPPDGRTMTTTTDTSDEKKRPKLESFVTATEF